MLKKLRTQGLRPNRRVLRNRVASDLLASLVSAPAGANTTVTRTSIGIAAEPVGRARFERVLQRFTGGRLAAGDLIAEVLRRTTRQGACRRDAERRQYERFHALLPVFLDRAV